MKRVLILVLALLFIAAGFGFAQKVTFAYMPGIEDPFMRMIEKGAAAKAKELGATLIVGEYPKAWGPDLQVPILEALVARGGFDFLIVVPTSNEALIAPLKKISDKGIPMITTDTFLGNGDYSKPSNFSFPLAYIGTDNELGGYEIGKRLAELIGNTGKVYMNTTNPDASSVTGRREGFKRAMKEFPDIEIVGIDYNLDVQETAQRQTAAVLQKHPDLKGIFGTNLYSAQGAYQAVENAGLTGEVKVAAWDATPDLINALKDGKVDLVLAQRPYQIGQLAAEWGYNYLTKKVKVPKKVIPGFFFFTRLNVDQPGSQSYIYQ